jgi:phospholipid transport system substrate-binding protein
MISRRFLLSVIGAGAIAFTAPAIGAASPETAAEFVRTLGDRAVDALTAKQLDMGARQDRFRSLFRESFDVDGIARFALGRYWRTASPEQQKEYTSLFEDHIVLAYAHRFSEYSGEAFGVATVRPGDDKNMIVTSELAQKNGPPVRLEWHLIESDSSYKIFDIVVEGVSMVQTKRSEFASAIQQAGGDLSKFFTALRRQSARLKAAGG